MEAIKRSAEQMVQMFQAQPELLEKLRLDPLPVLKETAARAEEITQPAYFRDRALYRIAVTVLSALALSAAVGSLILAIYGKPTPEVLVSLGSAAVGALVGLFAPSPSGK